MNKIKKNESGFSVVEALLIIILVVIGAVGYMVYHNDNKSKVVSANNTAKTSINNTSKASTTTTTNPYSGWSTYTDTSGWFTLKYPSDWTNNTAQAGSTVTEGPSQTQTTLTSNGQGNLGPTSLGQANNNFLIVTSDTYTGLPQSYIDSNNSSTTGDKDLTINGYQAHYGVGTNDGGDTYGTYEVFNNGKVAILNFLISTPDGQNYSSYESVESQITNSVQFIIK